MTKGEAIQSFLAARHARFSASPSAVAALATAATGHTVTDLDRVVGGYDNEVYRVQVVDGAAVFVRIRRYGDGRFDQESWAMDQARRAGVPVPEVLQLGSVTDEHGEHPAMVLATASGRELGALLPASTPTERQDALAELGRVLRTLHAVVPPGLWRPEDGRWLDPQAVRRGFVAERLAEQEHLVAAGLTLRVTGLIDWGMWQGSSPVTELAYVATWASNADLNALLEGYDHCDREPVDLRRAMALSLVNQARLAWLTSCAGR